MKGFLPVHRIAPALAIVLNGCGTGNGTTTEQLPTAAVQMNLMTTGTLMQHPWVPLSELACLLDDFADRIQLGPVGSEHPMGQRTLKVPVAELRAAADSVKDCTGGALRGVVVHVGLDSNAVFDAALELVCLVPVSGTTPQVYTHGTADRYYLLQSDHLVVQSGSIAAWQAAAGARYRDAVVIQRSTASAFAPFLDGHDITSLVFRYDGQLDRLIADNALDSTGHLLLVPTAAPRARTVADPDNVFEGDLAQGLCWLPGGVTLDNTVYTEPYKAKAADLGSPCPWICKKAIFPEQGLARRPGC